RPTARRRASSSSNRRARISSTRRRWRPCAAGGGSCPPGATASRSPTRSRSRSRSARPPVEPPDGRPSRQSAPPATSVGEDDMNVLDLDAYVGRSRALDLHDLDWDAVARRRLSPEAVRTLRYMQDIESHTIVYERELARTRAIEEPEVA